MVADDAPGEAAGTPHDGRRDFDFLHGRWHIANRKRANPLIESDHVWLEFESTSDTRPILGGLGNIERYHAPVFPGRPFFEGLTLRLFDPATDLWRIWWASTARPGILETPVVGQFRGRKGRFESDEVIDGIALKVRFDWNNINASSARWQQAFSFDDGANWDPNWAWSLTRES